MEIERKWLVSHFPTEYELIDEGVQEQAYISTKPTVRVRKSTLKSGTSFVICIKGKGKLAREEIETEVDEEFYNKVVEFLGRPCVRKDYKVYRLPSGEKLEVSCVDKGSRTEFMYAEVEFDSVEDANTFAPLDFFGEEKTFDPDFSMQKYWIRTMP